MRRSHQRLASAFLAPFVAFGGLEATARLLPTSSPTDNERALIWVAGSRPPLHCTAENACGTDEDLARLSNPRFIFAARPKPGTIRVVCIGDSATAGWPYHPRGGYPEWLRIVSQSAWPNQPFEIINLGVHAWDGARIEAMYDQALNLHPAAIVARFGYNDYAHFLLRHPRGGRYATQALAARIFLIEHSALFRMLARGFGDAPRRGIVATPAATLSSAEEDRLVADHRDRLRRFAAKARTAGIPLLLLDIPFWAEVAKTFPGLSTMARQRQVTREEAAALGLPFVSLTELTDDRFVDLVHSDLDGYRLTALSVAHALAKTKLLAGTQKPRWEGIPDEIEGEHLLALDDPDFRAHVELRLARLFAVIQRNPRRAEPHLAAALHYAPNPDLVPGELRESMDAPLRELYREVFSRLRREGKTADPLRSENRSLAGLPPPQS